MNMEILRMRRISKNLSLDYERFGFVFIGERIGNTIKIDKFYNLNEAIKKLTTNSDCVFIQMSTARKLGVIE